MKHGIILFVTFMMGVSIPAQGKTWAVLASGLNRDPDENRDKSQAIIRMRKFLHQEMNLGPETLTVCVDTDSLAASDQTRTCDRTTLHQTLSELAQRIDANDTFIFYYVGQANRIQDSLRLNVTGPDLCHADLVTDLNRIKARSSLIILDCPCAGLTIESLARPQRVIIAAAGSDQPLSPRFSQYFIPALADPNSDTNADERISLLEAFSATVRQLDEFFAERDLVATENPLLEDDADGVPSQKPWIFASSGKDGRVADQWFFSENKSEWSVANSLNTQP